MKVYIKFVKKANMWVKTWFTNENNKKKQNQEWFGDKPELKEGEYL